MTNYYLLHTNLENESTQLFAEEIRINLTKKASENSAEITIADKFIVRDGASFIEEGDFFSIYATKDFFGENSNTGEISNNNLIGTFVVVDFEINENDKTHKFICSDLTYKLLSGLFPRSIPLSAGLKASDVIDKVLQVMVQNGETQNSAVTNIQQTKSNGTQFPIISYENVYKTNYEVIKELSQTEYTGDDKEYLFWFDANNVFNWEYPDSEVQETVLNYISKNVLSQIIQEKKSDILVFIIYNAGVDKNGDTIDGYYLKPSATSLDGKQSYQPMTDISDLVKKNLGSDYDTITNEQFISLCEKVANTRAKSIIDKTNKGTKKSEIKVLPDYYSISKLYRVIGENFNDINMRVESITHLINRNGWQVSLSLEEDLV